MFNHVELYLPELSGAFGNSMLWEWQFRISLDIQFPAGDGYTSTQVRCMG
jgi:hypothetical protein